MARVISVIVYINIIVFSCMESSIASDEVCYGSRFQPRCYSNELIVIREAYYGRKTFEKCMSDEGITSDANLRDPSFIGCYTDVNDFIRDQCAGKKECDVIIADIKTETSCYKYLKHYLFASFECIKVVAETNGCTIKAAAENQHITNLKSSFNECGSNKKPWRIESLVGQKINISLLQIVGKNIGFASKDFRCNNVGSVVDLNNKATINICTNEGGSEKNLFFVTESNSIEIMFEDNQKESGFLITVQATGCSDLIPPADAWLKRTENEATIGCYSTRLRWQLKCVGQRWIGVIGNCSYGHVISHQFQKELEKEESPNQVVIVFIIVVAGLVVCLLIGCLGLVCLRRYYAMSKLKGIKHMNGLVDNFQPVYNKDSLHHVNNVNKMNHIPNGINFNGAISNGITANGSFVNLEDAQYFELDRSLVSKQDLLN